MGIKINLAIGTTAQDTADCILGRREDGMPILYLSEEADVTPELAARSLGMLEPKHM